LHQSHPPVQLASLHHRPCHPKLRRLSLRQHNRCSPSPRPSCNHQAANPTGGIQPCGCTEMEPSSEFKSRCPSPWHHVTLLAGRTLTCCTSSISVLPCVPVAGRTTTWHRIGAQVPQRPTAVIGSTTLDFALQLSFNQFQRDRMKLILTD